ncbi:MAG: Ycf66 family protein [Crocosphaera sp.]
MLAYILAIAVGLASLSLYLSAFFLPELHRKDDFLWSGVGLFYALVLWVCAGRMTGGVLLGQSAAVTLVLCFGWQTLRLRRAIAHPQEKTDLSGFSLLTWTQNRFQKKSPPVTPPVTQTPVVENTEEEEKANLEDTTAVIEEMAIAETETTEVETDLTSEVETEDNTEVETDVTSEVATETTEVETDITSEVETEDSKTKEETSSTVTATPETKKQGFSWKSIFGFGKSKSQPSTEPPKNLIEDTDLDEDEWEEEEDEKDVSEIEEVTSTLVEETSEEAIIESQTLRETSEEPIIESQTLTETSDESTDQASTQTPETLQEYVAELEPFIDDDAETLIENYQPKIEKSSPQTPEKSDKSVNDN